LLRLRRRANQLANRFPIRLARSESGRLPCLPATSRRTANRTLGRCPTNQPKRIGRSGVMPSRRAHAIGAGQLPGETRYRLRSRPEKPDLQAAGYDRHHFRHGESPARGFIAKFGLNMRRRRLGLFLSPRLERTVGRSGLHSRPRNGCCNDTV